MMTRSTMLYLSLLFSLLMLVQAQDTQNGNDDTETLKNIIIYHICSQSETMTSTAVESKANTEGYYPADSLNLIKLGLINGKNYLFVDQNISWFEASYFCNAYGMDLVTIETQSENELIMEHIVALGLEDRVFATAGHKIGRSTWLWLNGENMIYSDWAPGEPDVPATEHCMFLLQLNWESGRCNIDDNGVHKRGFVCEERIPVP